MTSYASTARSHQPRRWPWLALVPLLAALLLAAGELQEPPRPSPGRSVEDVVESLDQHVPAWMARDHVPGLCVGVVSGRERVLRCYGTADADRCAPLDGSSRFGIASVSKTFAALAVLSLAADGRFALDDPVASHLQSWRFPPGEFDGALVTIRQLLTHTAGVGVPSYGGATAPSPNETTRDVLDGRGVGREPVKLITRPGSRFSYSGGGYVVLQQLVEDTSRLSFERVVCERVFRPLGMEHSSFSWGAARLGDTNGHDAAGRPLQRRSYGAAMAPGAMVTTGEDLMRFVAVLAESRLAGLLGWPERTWNEFVSPDHPGYGMALVIGTTNDHLLVGHSGTTMGYNAGFTALPLEGAGWFVLENGNGGPYLKAEIDRTFLEWRTGATDPRYRLMQLIRAVVTFLGVLVPGLAILAIGLFCQAWVSGRVVALRPAHVTWVALAARLTILLALVTFVATWLAFFHTDAFYPAYTTAWLPFRFRGVTLGVVLFASRGALGALSARKATAGNSAHPLLTEPGGAARRADVHASSRRDSTPCARNL